MTCLYSTGSTSAEPLATHSVTSVISPSLGNTTNGTYVVVFIPRTTLWPGLGIIPWHEYTLIHVTSFYLLVLIQPQIWPLIQHLVLHPIGVSISAFCMKYLAIWCWWRKNLVLKAKHFTFCYAGSATEGVLGMMLMTALLTVIVGHLL